MRRLTPAALTILALSIPVSAQEDGFFAGLDLTGGAAFGSSSTTNGGMAPDAGGVVANVTFGNTIGIGGHVGRRIDPALSAFVSYRHIRGSVSWDAHFSRYGGTSDFGGDAISNVIMANIAHDWAVADDTFLRTSAGLGVSINSLTGVVETDRASGSFVTDVADHASLSPALEIGAGLRHRITPAAILGLEAAISYAGGFRTGDTRKGNMGVTAITPYEIDHVWRADLGASVKFAF